MKTMTIIVNEEFIGIRLDKFLVEYLEKHTFEQKVLSRTQIKKCIETEQICVNNQPVTPKYITKQDDEISIVFPKEQTIDEIVGENIPLTILFEDKDIVVVNKPPHLVVHPAVGNRSGTLVNALIYHCKNLASLGVPNRPGIVHRLDKDTSGAIVCAKTNSAYHHLVAQFKAKKVKKEYIAIVERQITQNSGEIDLPIGRHKYKRQSMAINAVNSKEAITSFELLFSSAKFSVVKVNIATGRTHQIRVHMAHIGHSVLADTKYGKTSKLIDRQALHAWKLTFTHPTNYKKLSFTAPIPEDMQKIFDDNGVVIKDRVKG